VLASAASGRYAPQPFPSDRPTARRASKTVRLPASDFCVLLSRRSDYAASAANGRKVRSAAGRPGKHAALAANVSSCARRRGVKSRLIATDR